MAAPGNSEAIEAWNTVLFDKFVRFRDLVELNLGKHGEVAMTSHPPPVGGRVLDVGCGFGGTTLDLARLVGDAGEAVGVDAAARFIADASTAATHKGVKNARFMTADVESDDLGGPYDHAFARFGTMFFSSPVRALRNVRRALKPGARLVKTVWRRRDDNPCFYLAEQIVKGLVPQENKDNAPTCGPGPFSMADADTLTTILLAAGFEDVTLTRLELPLRIGRDVDQAIEFALALGPAGVVLRRARAEAERLRPQVMAALREALTPLAGAPAVHAGSSTWVVSARAA